MTDLAKLLQRERERLLKIKEVAEERLSKSVDLKGKLRIATKNDQVYYYHRLPGEKQNGKYIRKKDSELAYKLAQKTYDEKVLKLVIKREKQFKEILKDYQQDEIERLYQEEKFLRKQLINPAEETWYQKLDNWKNKPYQGRPFNDNSPLIQTNKGERVRSKSEKILADYFDSKNIPYKYECPLFLKPYGIIYPDFTFLSKETGKEIYWEHEGKMDDTEYAKSAIKKIELYQNNNILLGQRLILTFETSTSVINMDTVKKYVDNFISPSLF